MDRLKATLQWACIPHYLWCFVILSILELINASTLTNRNHTPYQHFHNEIEPATAPYIPSLKHYKAIGTYCEALIPPEKRKKAYKTAAKTEPERLLAVLRSKNFLVYIPARKTVVKTPFIKLYEPKNPMLLKGAILSSKGIRPLNDVPATGTTEDSNREGENSSNQLPEIDDIGSSKQATTTPSKPTASLKPIEPPLRSLEPLELPRPLKKVSEPFEEPEDDEMLLDPLDQM